MAPNASKNERDADRVEFNDVISREPQIEFLKRARQADINRAQAAEDSERVHRAKADAARKKIGELQQERRSAIVANNLAAAARVLGQIAEQEHAVDLNMSKAEQAHRDAVALRNALGAQ